MTLSESTRGVLASLSTDLASAVQRAGRSIVAVHGRRRFPASGLAWSPDQVITAAHVLERDTDLSITAPDGTQYAANLVGRDPGADLAILAIPGATLQPIERSSETLSAGNLVLAVGRPGTPEPIASFGAISSVGGAWRTAQGGLLDAYVRARRAYLGVSTQPVDIQESLRSRLGIDQTAGLMLLGLEPGAPAERGGLYAGDIVLAIGGRTVEDGEALQMALGPDAIGRSTPIKLIRGGDLREIAVVPAPRPN